MTLMFLFIILGVTDKRGTAVEGVSRSACCGCSGSHP